MPAPEILEGLATRFAATPFPLGADLPAASLLGALRWLRDGEGYRYYVLGTATEREGTFEIVHAVRNLDTGDTLFVRVSVPVDAQTPIEITHFGSDIWS